LDGGLTTPAAAVVIEVAGHLPQPFGYGQS
jgi:hypothetical protein